MAAVPWGRGCVRHRQGCVRPWGLTRPHARTLVLPTPASPSTMRFGGSGSIICGGETLPGRLVRSSGLRTARDSESHADAGAPIARSSTLEQSELAGEGSALAHRLVGEALERNDEHGTTSEVATAKSDARSGLAVMLPRGLPPIVSSVRGLPLGLLPTPSWEERLLPGRLRKLPSLSTSHSVGRLGTFRRIFRPGRSSKAAIISAHASKALLDLSSTSAGQERLRLIALSSRWWTERESCRANAAMMRPRTSVPQTRSRNSGDTGATAGMAAGRRGWRALRRQSALPGPPAASICSPCIAGRAGRADIR